MKLLIYNIAYGTGSPGSHAGRLISSHRYIYTSNNYFAQISDFISQLQPDVIGLLEADSGSFRTGRTNHITTLAKRLNHCHLFDNKYGTKSPGRIIPLLRNQTNALLSNQAVARGHLHYFSHGFKKLVIEFEVAGITFFLVHLSVRKRVRALQLAHLAKLIPADRPVVVAGDFNTFGGAGELDSFKSACQLYDTNRHQQPTYPAWRPKYQLDYILCSHCLQVENFAIPQVNYSDHLPVWAEISLR